MTTNIETILIILILFNFKHLLSDFLFQTFYMLEGKKKDGWGFIYPLSLHCSVHVLLSMPIVIFYMGVNLWWLLPLEFIIHFLLDRLKAGPKYGGRFTMNESPGIFWFLFGVDQFFHQLTYILFLSIFLYS